MTLQAPRRGPCCTLCGWPVHHTGRAWRHGYGEISVRDLHAITSEQCDHDHQAQPDAASPLQEALPLA